MEFARVVVHSDLLDKISLPPGLKNRQVEVIVLPAGEKKHEQKSERPIGFAKGAEIPDSFFEPLSEEELRAWGL
jgi:hypothetical protein